MMLDNANDSWPSNMLCMAMTLQLSTESTDMLLDVAGFNPIIHNRTGGGKWPYDSMLFKWCCMMLIYDIWLVVSTPSETYELISWDDSSKYTWTKVMFQTTN